MVIDPQARVLIAQRLPGTHLAGSWEFPGGKLEPREARAAGLERELREELGIEIRQPRPLIRLRHVYPYGEVLLDVWVVRRYRGTPEGLDGQSLRWVKQGDLAGANLLPADRPIVAALRLPARVGRMTTAFYSIRDALSFKNRAAPGGIAAGDSKLAGALCSTAVEAAAAFAAGSDFLVLREPMADRELAALCAGVAAPVFARGMGLERAWALGASGINAIV